MDAAQKIQYIKETSLEYTQIVHISYEDGGSFTTPDGTSIENLPPFYRVRLESHPGSGSLIITEVWLPENWNKIFVGLGNGGMAGNIGYGALADKIKDGYAAANTDMGTSLGRDSGINNPDVWKDFGWRATHIMTLLGKAIVARCYGEKEQYSYFVGGSTGGQQALAEAQRFGTDYNGIIAAVPANNRTLLHAYFLWNHNHLRTRDGKILFTSEQITAISDCAAAFFQQHGDGIKGDNFVSFPQGDEQCISEFISFIAKTHPEFTDVQLDALNSIYTGPLNPITGERIYNGMPIGSEIYDCGIADCQGQESPHFYPFIWTFGADYDGYDFDFDKDLNAVNDKLAADLNANCSDLSAFCQNGGKMIMYSGSADPCVPYPDAMNYYDLAAKSAGGYEKLMQFCRYFLMPGKDHGAGGRGTNVLRSQGGKSEFDALRMWCEKGQAPDSLTAVREQDGKTVFERTLYPYRADKKTGGKCPPTCCEKYLKL